jgi:nucleotide-binding universal stress UspA family protein
MTFAPKHLFVPVDADVTGDRELAIDLVDAACDLAARFDAKITLCHVALPIVTSPVPPIDSFGEAYRAMADVLEARNASAGRVLAELKQRAEERGRSAEMLLVTKAGSVPDLIVESAESAGADLIMMATHGRRGLKRLVLGSVAERTAHLANGPVLLLPPKH